MIPSPDASDPSEGSPAPFWKEGMEIRIRAELRRWGLSGWTFYWDRARRRLGACWYLKRRISLSRYLIEDGREHPELWDTLLHEIAHALAYANDGERGHGVHWKKWCRFIGASPCRCAATGPLTGDSPAYRYALRRKDTGEIVARYLRKPRFKYPLGRMMLKGDPSSRGKLELVSWNVAGESEAGVEG